jgi:hypothetical protein
VHCHWNSAVLPFLNESFPTRLRGGGVGFTYNAGRAVGSVFPFFIGAVSAQMSLSNAISLFAIISFGLMLIVSLTIRETNGDELTS